MTSPEPISGDLDPARLTAVLQVLPVAAALFRRDGMAVAINSLGEELFVHEAQAALQAQHWRVMLRPFGDAATDAMAAVEATQAVAVRPVMAPNGDALFTIRAIAFDSALTLVTVDDHREELRRRLGHAEAERERQLASMGRLVAGMVHDVNNALNPIMSAAYLLQHQAESPVAVREYAERIRTATEIAAATGARLGRFVRQEPAHTAGGEEVDLSLLAGQVWDASEPMRSARASAHGEIQLGQRIEPRVCTRGIAEELRGALEQVVQNAIDAMPHGGTLTVACWNEDLDACLAVQDTGTGMAHDALEHAFEPFFTTKGVGHSGLGLAEVYGIVRGHRGQVRLTSVAGQGTTVTLRFPRMTGGRVAKAPATAATFASERSLPLRILVVEDDNAGRALLRRVLEGDGHAVEAVASIAEAVRHLVASEVEPYDVLLTDVGLPDGSGWNLARDAIKTWPSTRIGVITGWAPMTDDEVVDGVEFVLRKPLRLQELRDHIARRPNLVSNTE